MESRLTIAYAILALLIAAPVLLVIRARFVKRRARRGANQPIDLLRRE